MADFYLWSRKHSKEDVCLWWRPESCGYTTHLDQAGVYTEAQAKSIEAESGRDVLAVPASVARGEAFSVVSCDRLSNELRRLVGR